MYEQDTFYKNFGGDFTSRCDPSVSCPPSIIARVAQNRIVEDSEIVLPEGVTDESLSQIRGITGIYDKGVRITPRQAEELQDLGRQILALNENQKIQPPLTLSEKASITHLIDVVGKIT